MPRMGHVVCIAVWNPYISPLSGKTLQSLTDCWWETSSDASGFFTPRSFSFAGADHPSLVTRCRDVVRWPFNVIRSLFGGIFQRYSCSYSCIRHFLRICRSACSTMGASCDPSIRLRHPSTPVLLLHPAPPACAVLRWVVPAFNNPVLALVRIHVQHRVLRHVHRTAALRR